MNFKVFLFFVVGLMFAPFASANEMVDAVSLLDIPTFLQSFSWYEQALAYYLLLSSIVGAFAQIAAMTPTRKDDRVVSYLTRFIHFMGMNFGFAKNKDA